MKIRKAIKGDIKKAMRIANELHEWFDETARTKTMPVDFELNNLVVAIDKNEVIGFLCYTSNCGRMLLIWMGVKKDIQRKGVGFQLMDWLSKEARKLGLQYIEVETLPDEDDYEPYKLTRNFYYKMGFKRIAYKKARIKGWDDQIVLEKEIK